MLPDIHFKVKMGISRPPPDFTFFFVPSPPPPYSTPISRQVMTHPPCLSSHVLHLESPEPEEDRSYVSESFQRIRDWLAAVVQPAPQVEAVPVRKRKGGLSAQQLASLAKESGRALLTMSQETPSLPRGLFPMGAKRRKTEPLLAATRAAQFTPRAAPSPFLQTETPPPLLTVRRDLQPKPRKVTPLPCEWVPSPDPEIDLFADIRAGDRGGCSHEMVCPEVDLWADMSP